MSLFSRLPVILVLDAGNHRFRLQQIDYDGGYAYSPVVEAVDDGSICRVRERVRVRKTVNCKCQKP